MRQEHAYGAGEEEEEEAAVAAGGMEVDGPAAGEGRSRRYTREQLLERVQVRRLGKRSGIKRTEQCGRLPGWDVKARPG